MSINKNPFLSARNLTVSFENKKFKNTQLIHALDGVDLDLFKGEILGLVGESGCGKTTLGRTLLGQQREKNGDIWLNGVLVSKLEPKKARQVRKDIQYVHQDPGAALDPWWTVHSTLHESLIISGVLCKDERQDSIDFMLKAVGLDPTLQNRYPHEFSGGQLRRIGIARTLIQKPSLVILDEPTSGLDLSVQATVLKLLLELKERFGLTYVFISHDLSVIKLLCTRVMVMYMGRIIEAAPAAYFGKHHAHPYSKALWSAAPQLDPDARIERPVLLGDPPSASSISVGCRFEPRCPIANPSCKETSPILKNISADHMVACDVRL
jgi:oligopeptide/dipeptide ABC transporter ATP-binding protein